LVEAHDDGTPLNWKHTGFTGLCGFILSMLRIASGGRCSTTEARPHRNLGYIAGFVPEGPKANARLMRAT
jgi:hypothetical protein